MSSKIERDRPVLTQGSIPDGWTKARLGDICQIVRGVTYRKNQASQQPAEGKVPILRATNVQNSALVLDSDLVYVPSELVSDIQKLRVGDIVVATSSGSKHLVGKTAQVLRSWEGSFGAFCAAIRPKIDIDHRYLGYFFNSRQYKDYISAKALGVNINNLRRGDLEEISVPVAPKVQQQQIVAEIEKQSSRLDEAVASLKRVKLNLKRYKASVLKAAVEGKLTEDWRKQHPNVEPASKLLERILLERRANWEKYELVRMKLQGVSPRNETWKKRYRQAEPPKSDEAYAIPQGWVWANLGQLSWSVKDGPHYSPKYSERGIPFISGGNIRPEGIDFSTAKFISPELHEELSERCKPEYGDLLYTKGGTTGIARINTERKEFSVWVHVAVLKLVDSINRFYLQHALNSPHCYRQSQKYTHGVGNQDLGLTRMIWITVPLPSLAEQEQIVDQVERRLSVIEELEAAVEANLTRADRLRQSVLQLAFSGRLKVTERAVNLSTLVIAAEPDAPYISIEEIVVSKRPITSSRDRRTLLEALEGVDSPVAPEELFSLCGFDSRSIEQVERFYAELNELISANKVEELRPTQDRVTLKVIQ